LQSASDPAHEKDLQARAEADKNDPLTVALNKEVANAVTKGLSYFGAGPVVESLVYILELEHSVDLNSLANNLDALRAALQKMFGGAAYVIEGKITESLAKQLGVDPDGKKLDELVTTLRERLEKSPPTEKRI
jgi:hypothetical protein